MSQVPPGPHHHEMGLCQEDGVSKQKKAVGRPGSRMEWEAGYSGLRIYRERIIATK